MDNETMAGVTPFCRRNRETTSCECKILQFLTVQRKLRIRIKVSREKQCFNTQFAHMSSVFCPDRQVLLMLLSWSNNCPSTAPFQSPIQVNSSSIEQNVSIQKSLSVAFSLLISYIPTASTWHHARRKLHKLFYQLFYLK